VHVVGLSRGLGELGDVGQGRPRGPVDRGLDGHLPGPVPQDHLDVLIRVPDAHPIQPDLLVEVVPDPGRLCAGVAEPHVRQVCGVPPLCVEPGAVHGLARLCIEVVHPRGRSRAGRDGIGIGLGREGPHSPLVDRCAGRRADLIHAPGIGLAEGEQPRWVIGVGILARTCEHAPGVGPGRVPDVLESGPEVHVVCHCIGSGPPGQHRVARHVHSPVPGLGGRGDPIGPRVLALHHGPDPGRGEGQVVDAEVVQRAAEVRVRAVLGTAQPVLGRGPQGPGCVLRRGVLRDGLAVHIEHVGRRVGIDGHGHVVPPREKGRGRGHPIPGTESGQGEDEVGRGRAAVVGCDHKEGRGSCPQVEDVLVGLALARPVDPDREGRAGQAADQRTDGQLHVVVDAVQPQGAVDPARLPDRTVERDPMPPLAR